MKTYPCPHCGRPAKDHGCSGYSEPKYPENYELYKKYGMPVEMVILCPLNEANILRKTMEHNTPLEEIGMFVLSVFNRHPDCTRYEIQEDLFRAAFLFFMDREKKMRPGDEMTLQEIK